MSNPFDLAIGTLRDEWNRYFLPTELPERQQIEAAIRVLEAAGFLLPLINIPEDGKWYRLSATVKRVADEYRTDELSVKPVKH